MSRGKIVKGVATPIGRSEKLIQINSFDERDSGERNRRRYRGAKNIKHFRVLECLRGSGGRGGGTTTDDHLR